MTLRQVGHYRLEGLLGSGGMGEVYKAYDTRRDRYVALKLLPEGFSGDQEYLKRFQRESHVAARLTEPHVIPIHDFGEIDGQLFIDMRLVDGADICTLLDENGRIEPHRAVNLISQVAEALDAAHGDNLVHRDIKPSNILVTPSDFVYVVDFGIARSMGGQQTALTITGATIGTLHYMAPERFIGHNVDGRADVYSLACVLHECLTGASPFNGKDLAALMYAQLYYGPPAASSLVEGVPPALDAVIARGMAKDPEDRFQTAGELAAAAREAMQTEGSTSAWSEPEVSAWSEPEVSAWSEPEVSAWSEPEAPAWSEPEAPLWTEMLDPTWQAGASATRQDVAMPPAPEPELAGDTFARGVPYSPTQSVSANGVRDWASTRPPEYLPPGAGPDSDDSRLPPGGGTGGLAREPARRRLGLLILAAVVVVAVPIALVLLLSRPHTGTPGATGTGTSGAHSSASSTVSGAAASFAVPTVAKMITVGHNPNYVQVAPNGKFAYVVNTGAGAIYVLNTANNQVTGVIDIPQGPPQSVSFSPDSRSAYVSIYNGSNSIHLVAFINTATNKVTGTVTVNNHSPGPSASSPDGRYLYVPNHNLSLTGTDENAIDVIDTASMKVVDTIAVKPNPHWIVFGKNNGRFYATDHLSAVITVLNAKNNSVIGTIEVGETPHSIAISPDGSRLAITSYNGNEVYIVSTATDQEIAKIPVGREPLDIAYSPDGRYIYTTNNLDNTITVIDAADNRAVATVPTGKAPTSISVLPNGKQAYVTDENDGTIEVLNLNLAK